MKRRGVKSKCPHGEEGERTPSWRGGEKTLLGRRVREHTQGEGGREHPPGEEGERIHSWKRSGVKSKHPPGEAVVRENPPGEEGREHPPGEEARNQIIFWRNMPASSKQ